MGQIPNKTYTAPDGSVYRVEADGSITKLTKPEPMSHKGIWRRTFVLLILAGVLSVGYYYRQYQIDKNAPRKYPIVNINLRSSKDIKDNYLNTIPAGSELIVYDIDGDWAKVKYINDDANVSQKGYVAAHYLLDKFDNILISGIIPDEDVQTVIASTKVRKALINYFKENHYIGNNIYRIRQELDVEYSGENLWQVIFHHGRAKPNEILFSRNRDPKSKYPDMAVIIENILSHKRKLLYFTFDYDETPHFIFEVDAPLYGDIFSIERYDIKDNYGRVVKDCWVVRYTTDFPITIYTER